MSSQFSNHSQIGKTSLIIALLTILFFVLGIVIVVVAVVINNPILSLFGTIFNLLVFVFSIVSLVLGAIAFWGKDKDRYGLFAFIVGLIFIILLFISIAIAATAYVYVSGMLGSPDSSSYGAPNIAALVDPDSGNNATLQITYIDEEDVIWYHLTIEIYDITDGEYLTEYTDYTTDMSYDIIENSDIVKFTGIGDEFQENHDYRMTITYYLNNQVLGIYNWTQ